MSFNPRFVLTRRRLLWLGLALPIPIFLAACSDDEAQPTATSTSTASAPPAATSTSAPASIASATVTSQPQLAATPACGDDDDDVTASQTEGPYFTPNSPERTSLLESGMSGARLTLTGFVFDTNCRPVARALIDFWQADDAGEYDNAGYRLRGHQFTDDRGRYELTTIVPGLYPGRTRHIHVKVQAQNQPILTTQLYFPGEVRNSSDGIYSSALLMDVQDAAGGAKTATFDFVLDLT